MSEDVKTALLMYAAYALGIAGLLFAVWYL